MIYKHASVLLNEVLENLKINPAGVYVDGTLGGGGHTFQIASRLTEGGRVIGIDQDEDAIDAASKHLKVYEDRVTLIHDNYEHLPEILKALEIKAVDGILLDLGVSSYQLDNPERGFSYHVDAPLDMRMDRQESLTAKTIVNEYEEAELVRILSDYGEEKCARQIAANIVKRRAEKPIERTGELADIVYASIPMKMRREGGNPCKRTFQAIRIACNRELEVLENSLSDMISLLKPGGRICVITFHSLEDRIAKAVFKLKENPCTCPPEFPICVCGKKPEGKQITKKPILPSAAEIEINKRAQSAKLRVFEKIKENG